MAKQGEIDYLDAIGEGGRRHAVGKPYSDPDCGGYLARVGQIMDLLPPPPARILELGCGTGWVSLMLARRGFDVVARDIAPEMIRSANLLKAQEGLTNVEFGVGDYESLSFDQEFDGVVFFDSLHHAEDERSALMRAYESLRDGGICVAAEPGTGHSETQASRDAMDRYGVIEKDMPPRRIRTIARAIGYTGSETFPHAVQLIQLAGSSKGFSGRSGLRGWILNRRFLRPLLVVVLLVRCRSRNGVVVLRR